MLNTKLVAPLNARFGRLERSANHPGLPFPTESPSHQIETASCLIPGLLLADNLLLRF